MKRVGAVICNFNKKEDVLNCIQSVLESKYTDYDLYVVDNASSDGSAEAIREKYGSQVTVLVNAENLGCTLLPLAFFAIVYLSFLINQ